MSSLVSSEITAGNSKQQTSVIAHKPKLYVCSKHFTVLTCLVYISLTFTLNTWGRLEHQEVLN